MQTDVNGNGAAPTGSEEDSFESWETVYVTPHTAENDLCFIAAPRCFVLNSTGGVSNINAPLRTSLHAAVGGTEDTLDSTSTVETGTGAEASTTLPSNSDVSALSNLIEKTATTSFTTAATNVKVFSNLEKEAEGPYGGGCNNGVGNRTRPPFELFGAYRRVRVIHNTAPCLIRCAAEAGPQLPLNLSTGPHNNSNTFGSTSVMSGVPTVVNASTSVPPSSQERRQQQQMTTTTSSPYQRPIEQFSSLMQTSFHSTKEALTGLSSPPASPPSQQRQQTSTSTIPNKTVSVGGASRKVGATVPQATTQQLHQLAKSCARSALWRMSKASSRRSHASLSTLPESVIFLDPLEIIAEAAISFVDVVFAAHVSVKGKGPVQFVNCCFGHRSTSQLCQHFSSHPLTSETRGDIDNNSISTTRNRGDSDERSRRPTFPTSTVVGDLAKVSLSDAADEPCTDSSEDNRQLSGRADPPVSQDRGTMNINNTNNGSAQRPPPWGGTPSRFAGVRNNSGVFGLRAGFSLPVAMRVIGERRRVSLLNSSASASPTCTELSRGKRASSMAPSKVVATFGTMASMHYSAATSVLEVHGDGYCVLNQCDLYGGCVGTSLVCLDGCHVSVTDSSFEGPSITWAAVEVRDRAAATIEFTNILQVMGVGVLVTDYGQAKVNSSVIERCGIAGVVATDHGMVTLQNTSIEASVSGVCVSLSGAAEAKMASCEFTTRFPLPRRAAGLMFLEHLQSLGAFRTSKVAGLATSTHDYNVSVTEDPLLQHALNADFESLLGLWLLHIGAADTAFPTSSQSFVLCDHAAASVVECEFKCTVRLPGSAPLTSTTDSAGGHNFADTVTLEENPSTSGSRADRSDGAVPSFTGLPTAGASVVAAVFSGSDANLSATNSRGLSISGHNLNANTSNSRPFLFPGSSVTRRLPGVVEEPVTRHSLTHVARHSTTAYSESIVDGLDNGKASSLLPGLARNASRSSVAAVPLSLSSSLPNAADMGGATTTTATRAAAPIGLMMTSPPVAAVGTSTVVETNAHSMTGTPAASTANGPPSLHHVPTYGGPSSLPSNSPLPLPARRVVAGLLSSFVMAREVFGEYIGERRRLHAAESPLPPSLSKTNNNTSKTNPATCPLAGDSRRSERAASGADPRCAFGENRTCTELFLSFEALTEVEDKDDAADAKVMQLSSTASRSTANTTTNPNRRFSNLSTAAMGVLNSSLEPLGCLAVLMAPNGGVYHIVASHQASLTMTSSVLSLALPPRLTLPLPGACAFAASYYVGGAGGFSSTIRMMPAPFVAAVLDYREPEIITKKTAATSAADAPVSHGVTKGVEEINGNETGGFEDQQHQQRQLDTHQFCSIFTRSNVIQYECVPMTNSLCTQGPSIQQHVKRTFTLSSAQRQEMSSNRNPIEGDRSTTTNTAGSSNYKRGYAEGNECEDDGDTCNTRELYVEEDFVGTGNAFTVHSILGTGVSTSSYNNSLQWKGTNKNNSGEGDIAGKPDAPRAVAATTIGAKSYAPLPPRPASASVSAAQHVHTQQRQQEQLSQQQRTLHPSDDHNASSSAVEFNTAAWGLVLVTPPTPYHSVALTTAARLQAEHWCRVELTSPQTPTTTQGGSRETSSTALPTVGEEGPLEVPASLCTSATLRSATQSTRTAGGSTSTGRNSTDTTVTANNSAARTKGAKLHSVDSTGDIERSRRATATTAAINLHEGTRDTQNPPMRHHGNIFMNMANKAELLGVTHPDHVYTTFSTFAHVMELPVAQEYPISSSAQDAFVNIAHPASAFKQSTDIRTDGDGTSDAGANARNAPAGTGGDVVAIRNGAPAGLDNWSLIDSASGRTAAAATMPTINATAAAAVTTRTTTPTAAITTATLNAGAAGMATTNAALGTISAHSMPATSNPYSTFSSTMLMDREAVRLHINDEMQRWMLLDDIDAPPLLAAVAAAAVHARRDDARSAHFTHTSAQGAARSSLLQSMDHMSAGGVTNPSISPSRPSSRSPLTGKRTAERGAITTTQPPTATTTVAPATTDSSSTSVVKTMSQVASTVTRAGANSSRHSSGLPGVSFNSSSTVVAGAGNNTAAAAGNVFLAAGPSAQQQVISPGGVQPPTPPELEIFEVESVDFSSHSSDSDHNCSSDDAGSSSGNSDQGSGSSSSSRDQPHERYDPPENPKKSALLRKPSSVDTNNSAYSKDKRLEEYDQPVDGEKEIELKRGVPQNEVSGGAHPTMAHANFDDDRVLVNVESDTEESSSSSPKSAARPLSGNSEPYKKGEHESDEKPAITKVPGEHSAPLPGVSLRPRLSPLSAASLLSASAPSRSAPQSQSNVLLPEFQVSLSNSELLVPSRPQRSDIPLVASMSALSSSSSGTLPSSALSSNPHSPPTTASSYSSMHNHNCDVIQHHQPSLRVPSSKASHNTQHTWSNCGSTECNSDRNDTSSGRGSSAESKGWRTNKREMRKGSEATSADAPVALRAALERMTHLEEQLEQMQRLMLVQQTQMARMHSAFPPYSATSAPDMCVFDNQPSLLVLPPATRYAGGGGGSDSAGGGRVDPIECTPTTSKYSRPTQSDSYHSSFSGKKLQSTCDSQETPDQAINSFHVKRVAGAAGAEGGVSVAQDGGIRHTENIKRSSITPPIHPAGKPDKDERQSVTGAHEEHAAGHTAEPAEGDNNNSHRLHDQIDTHASVSVSITTGVGALEQPPAAPTKADDTQQRQTTPPATTPTAAVPVAAAAGRGSRIAPSPPMSPPHNTSQSPPLRSRLRRPSAGTTLEILLAAAHRNLLGTPLATYVNGGRWIEGTNPTENNTLLNVQEHRQQEQQQPQNDALDEWASAEERRWREALVRRLQFAHRSGGTVERWRERLPFPSSPPDLSTVGGEMGLARYATRVDVEGSADEIGEHNAVEYEYSFGVSEYRNELQAPHQSGSAVAYEPWRTTVATGTRYAHRPPPHPYSFPAQLPFNAPSDATTATSAITASRTEDGWSGRHSYCLCEEVEEPRRWREPVTPAPPPPASIHSITSGVSSFQQSPRALRMYRSNFCRVPENELVNSLQGSFTVLSPAINTSFQNRNNINNNNKDINLYPSGLRGLHFSSRRRDHLRTTQPLPPPLKTAPPPLHHAPPPVRGPSLPGDAGRYISHLHKDHLADQYGRAVRNAVLAQSQAKTRQSEQVRRLYTEPMRDRMHRIAAQTRPTQEQLYRLHGCTFMPKINQGRGIGTTRRGTLRRTNTSLESLRNPPSTLPSNNTTKTCHEASSTTNAQHSRSGQRRRSSPR